jgi:hypothetical protein
MKDDSCYCQYGCENGICKPSAIQPSQLTGNVFDIVKNLTESSFSGWFLTLISVFVTAGSSIYADIMTKKWQIALGIGMMSFLFFLFIGWLPSWLGILWILSVAIILMKGLFFKGD